jgi:hypothetical protein
MYRKFSTALEPWSRRTGYLPAWVEAHFDFVSAAQLGGRTQFLDRPCHS